MKIAHPLRRSGTAALALSLGIGAATPALAAPEGAVVLPALRHSAEIPDQLSENDRAKARSIFIALRAKSWDDAKSQILSLDEKEPLRAYALAELYLAKDSPRVELFDLLKLLNNAAWLPQADRLSALAKKRGAEILPSLPQVHRLSWMAGAPRREYGRTVKTDLVAQALGTKILPLIKNDDPVGAEALLTGAEPGLTVEGLTEWRQRVAWSYYIENDDGNARRLAQMAATDGTGSWQAQAWWTVGLASWRQNDCRAAAPAFQRVAAMADSDDMKSAGYYWAARAYMVCGDPAKVSPLMRAAAQLSESFYGLLARETLGLSVEGQFGQGRFGTSDWAKIRNSPNARLAIALVEAGEDSRADDLLKFQAKLGGDSAHDCLVRLARGLNLPATQIWLAHNVPGGERPDSFARYPAPDWKPDGGWRVDKSLLFAHALQESGFRSDAVSSAGAVGLMQVRPGTARGMMTASDATPGADLLTVPSTNMEYGQRYLEQLRDMQETGGLLPKVMAAYNAGPTPIGRWAFQVRDNGDPLLFIESMPYYETRAYVNIVMRNYWMYQLEDGQRPVSLSSMAQGLWPKFPGMSGAPAVRVTANQRPVPVAMGGSGGR